MLFPINALSHCEIPCGIFGDDARFVEMLEHADTIQKSMDQINQLSKKDKIDYHMIARWTINKEDHAEKIQHIASQYFLTQRVKIPSSEASQDDVIEYERHTTLLHGILVKAMNTKQTTDKSAVDNLRKAILEYKSHYLKDHEH